MAISRLTDRESKVIESLALARGESREEVLARFDRDALKNAPTSFSKHMPALGGMEFTAAGVRDGLAYVKLPNGRVFWGWQSKPNHRRAFSFVRDKISEHLDEDTYLLGIDVAQRYCSDLLWPPADIAPPEGGVIIECGAYLGHKTIRLVDQLVGESGKVIAVEMMPDNVAILKRNVKENGLEGVIKVVHAGVWKERGVLPVNGKGRQRNTLVDLEKLTVPTGIMVPVVTVDDLLAHEKSVDLMVVTINGAEVEVLQSMNTARNKVKTIAVAAIYEIVGESSFDLSREILVRNNWCIHPSSGEGVLYAVRCTR